MRIVSHKRLKEFYETNGHEDARVALERWYDIAEKAERQTINTWIMILIPCSVPSLQNQK